MLITGARLLSIAQLTELKTPPELKSEVTKMILALRATEPDTSMSRSDSPRSPALTPGSPELVGITSWKLVVSQAVITLALLVLQPLIVERPKSLRKKLRSAR